MNKSGKLQRKENLAGYLFCAPGLLLFLAVGLYSVIFSMYISFHNWAGVDFAGTARFVGLENFKIFLANGNPYWTQMFRIGLFNNLKIGIFTIIFVIPIALSLAFVVTHIKRLAGVYRTIYFIPMVATGVGVYYVWQGLYNPKGAVNTFLSTIGLDALVVENGFFGDPRFALTGVIIAAIWAAIPNAIMLYYAGLSNIDETLYEAASIDGANRFQILWRITWPLLRPMTTIIMIQLFNGALQSFENVYVLTKGGPADSTQVVGTWIYEIAFKEHMYGLATAMGWTMFALTLVFSLLSMRKSGAEV
jgi:ABC-type sugar transport system permease subunit